MVNILTPNRFYQLESIDGCGGKLTLVIDLKNVTQITLRESEKCKEIYIDTGTPHQPRPIIIGEEKVAIEEYRNIVTAWTTYKLSTKN